MWLILRTRPSRETPHTYDKVGPYDATLLEGRDLRHSEAWRDHNIARIRVICAIKFVDTVYGVRDPLTVV